MKWIKIYSNIFEDDKIAYISTLPKADSVILFWFRLLCYAGELGNNGIFTINIAGENKPFTAEMLAKRFNKSSKVLQNYLEILQKLKLISTNEHEIKIINFAKYQTYETSEKRQTYTKEYMRGYRKKDNDENVNGLHNSLVNGGVNEMSTVLDVDVDLDVEEDKILKDIPSNPLEKQLTIDYQGIAESYNNICRSLPKLLKMTDNRKKAVHARLVNNSVEDIIKAFHIAENSDFIKGANNRNWKADFDWIMTDSHITSILEGKYGGIEEKSIDPPNPKPQSDSNIGEVDNAEFEKIMEKYNKRYEGEKK